MDIHELEIGQVEHAHIDFTENLEQFLNGLQVAPTRSAYVAQKLWDRMTEPHRHYHTPLHVLGMFCCANEMNIELGDVEQLAIWFHDAIYHPPAPAGLNEHESAKLLARMTYDLNLPKELIDGAVDAIECTSRYLDEDVPPQFKVIMDLDLSNLSAPPGVFQRTGAAVAREYTGLSQREMLIRNVAFFTTLLDRPAIYRSSQFADREQIARKQVQSEMDRLSEILRNLSFVS